MRLTFAGSVVLCVLASLLFAASAPAQDQTRLVTIAARSCPTYPDITANRARNNIMESLKDLGADTPYGGNIPFLVDPAVEAAVQPNCTAIDNWQLTLGTGITIRNAVPPEPWGRLSYVTGPFSPTIFTQSAIPLLNGVGQPTGATISGATTVTLTDEQRRLATQGSKLWIQGGTPAAPITDSERYGFGALRCATDNLNGDNVEWISYPPNTTHVFCFAYYVTPPWVRLGREVGHVGTLYPADQGGRRIWRRRRGNAQNASRDGPCPSWTPSRAVAPSASPACCTGAIPLRCSSRRC